jgi:hypothetical protein
LLNLETIYDDYLDRLQEERKEKYKEYEEWFSGSSAGSCYKKQWYKVNGFEPEPFDQRTKRLLRLGTIVHSDVEQALSEAEPSDGVEVLLEHEIKIPEFNVVGHLDHCFIRKEDNNIEIYVSDLKTLASYSWTRKFGRNAIKQSINMIPSFGHYELQVATYALGMLKDIMPDLPHFNLTEINYEIDKVKNNISINIIWYNKNDSKMKTTEISVDALHAAIAYWNDLNDFTNEEKGIESIPPNGAVGVPMQDWECKYCQYKQHCIK